MRLQPRCRVTAAGLFLLKLSVKALRLCQLPRGGSLHICKDSSSERSGCPSHTTSPSSSLTLDATSPSRGGLGRRFVFRLIRLRLQNHHLPQGKDFAPAVQTGAKRQTPKTRRYAKGSPTRGAVAAKPATERLDKGEACHRPQTLRHRFGSAAPLYNLSFALFLPHLLLH